jgi:hypothetical protein
VGHSRPPAQCRHKLPDAWGTRGCPQVRTQTLVKNAIIQVDATPFKQWYLQHYAVDLGNKKADEGITKIEDIKVCPCPAAAPRSAAHHGVSVCGTTLCQTSYTHALVGYLTQRLAGSKQPLALGVDLGTFPLHAWG